MNGTEKGEENGLARAKLFHTTVIWEITQAFIAVAVVLSVLIVSSMIAIKTDDKSNSKIAGFVFLTGAANLVIGFYFGRTNHQPRGKEEIAS